MRPAILLIALLLASCSCRPFSKEEPTTVVIPPDPCVLPMPPRPLGKVAIFDCDGDGPERQVCMTEDSAVVMFVYVKQLQEWIKLAENCPGTKIEYNGVPMPSGVPRVVEETKETM